ncbi:hypothetical protein BN988_01163 [Oceanobacillus picturae]|uniref:Intracellular proteinase inhibitor n=1 Tax=Oceanobacillus picturae TaxID=171693 RepID=W9AB42_9BACI|nr:hypothetical protein [Oceanobacillus picturae]CDO02688.1 hypothetical protein BN988_01163 [Oceanobacillus picturae]
MKKSIIIALALLLVGCSNEQPTNESAENNDGGQGADASVSIRNVEVEVDDALQATITGEAALAGSDLYYQLEQGDVVLISEAKVELDSNPHGLSPFELLLQVPEDAVSGDQAPIVKFYGKDQSGEEVNQNYVPIDLKSK